MKKTVALLLLLGMVSYFSCDFGVDTRTLNVMKDLIKTLDQMPDKWEETIKNSIDELGIVGGDLAGTIADELQNVLDSTQSTIQGTLMCSTDFVIDRVQTEVKAIGHNHFPNEFEAPVFIPHVCNTSPRDLIAISDKVVVFSGYYFTRYAGDFTADVEYADQSVLFSDLDVAISTDYMLSVNLQTIPWSDLIWDTLPDSPQLVLRWDNSSSEILFSICSVDHPETVNPDYTSCINSCTKDINSWLSKCKSHCPKVWPGRDICRNDCNKEASSRKKSCVKKCNSNYPPISAYTEYQVCE